jgi:hypothetical protein
MPLRDYRDRAAELSVTDNFNAPCSAFARPWSLGESTVSAAAQTSGSIGSWPTYPEK